MRLFFFTMALAVGCFGFIHGIANEHARAQRAGCVECSLDQTERIRAIEEHMNIAGHKLQELQYQLDVLTVSLKDKRP